jgi:hypothetical protein
MHHLQFLDCCLLLFSATDIIHTDQESRSKFPPPATRQQNSNVLSGSLYEQARGKGEGGLEKDRRVYTLRKTDDLIIITHFYFVSFPVAMRMWMWILAALLVYICTTVALSLFLNPPQFPKPSPLNTLRSAHAPLRLRRPIKPAIQLLKRRLLRPTARAVIPPLESLARQVAHNLLNQILQGLGVVRV